MERSIIRVKRKGLPGSGVKNAEGVWTKFFSGGDVGPLPPAITGRTIAKCRNHDVVCAPPGGSVFLNQSLIYDSAIAHGRILQVGYPFHCRIWVAS